MHPAPSVIVFTVLSGAGFGLLCLLGLGQPAPAGRIAFLLWGLGYGLAVSGLVASTFHLGNPQRFLRAFSQWRTSWLSREGWASVLALTTLAPVALSDWLGLGWGRGLGVIGAILALATIFATSMIYAQIKAIPRWHHWTVPVLFIAFAAVGGAVLAGHARFAALSCAVLAATLIASFRLGDGQFAKAGQTLGTATGLDRIGEVTVFEQAHTAGNYLLREMIYVVARKHARKLRVIAVILACLVPGLIVLILSGPYGFGLAALIHLTGAATARWLFFAEAEHVVGLYYGQR